MHAAHGHQALRLMEDWVRFAALRGGWKGFVRFLEGGLKVSGGARGAGCGFG